MSVALYYETVAPVDAAARTAVERSPPDGLGPWWCEGLHLWDAGEGRLGGSTKLFRLKAWTKGGTVVDVDPGEDTLMAWHDCRRIVARLGAWSEQHGMTWRLEIEGAPFGEVTSAGADASLVAAMRQLLEHAGVLEDAAPAAVARILAKYPPPG